MVSQVVHEHKFKAHFICNRKKTENKKEAAPDCSSIIRKLRTPFLWCDWRTSVHLSPFFCPVHQNYNNTSITSCHVTSRHSTYDYLTQLRQLHSVISTICSTAWKWTGVGNQGLSNRIRGQSSTPMPVSFFQSFLGKGLTQCVSKNTQQSCLLLAQEQLHTKEFSSVTTRPTNDRHFFSLSFTASVLFWKNCQYAAPVLPPEQAKGFMDHSKRTLKRLFLFITDKSKPKKLFFCT